MDWKIFAGTFLTIFLAEIGDKTQFAAIAAATSSKSTGTILCAVIAAVALSSALGVIFGKFLAAMINPHLLRYISGISFLLLGAWVLTNKN